jgi:PAS domain S-box-containing protein
MSSCKRAAVLRREILDLIQDALSSSTNTATSCTSVPACEYLLGYKPSELVGGNMIDHIHPEDRSRTLNRVWQIMQGVSASRFRNRWMHKHGHPVGHRVGGLLVGQAPRAHRGRAWVDSPGRLSYTGRPWPSGDEQ